MGKSSFLKHNNVMSLCEEKHLDEDRIHSMFKTFKESDEYAVICAHLEDYKNHVLGQMTDMPMTVEGYDRVIAARIARLSTIDWFKTFIEELKGFDESERSARPSLKDKYL